jgi:hypothetical protein
MNDAELALIVAALDEGQVLITRHQEDEWGIARVGGDALERNVYRYWASRFGPEEQHTEERLDSAGVRARLAGYTYATIRTRLRRS